MEKESVLEVVGTMFFKDGKLLIDKPKKRPTFQMIGGMVEKTDANKKAAAVRECREELGEKFKFDENKIEFVSSFEEIATNNPNQKIRMNIFRYTGEFSGEFTISEEIEKHMWYGIEDDREILSNSLKHKVIPMCIEKGWIY